jgi:uncharacterized protein (TIGR00270 family)
MTTCELCGKEVSKVIDIEVVGSKMRACDKCKKLGKIVEKDNKNNLKHSFRKKKKINIESEVVSDYERILNQALSKSGLNIHQLAKALNIKESSLNKYFSGKIKPDVDTAIIIGRYLEIDLVEDRESEEVDEEDYMNDKEESSQNLGDLLMKKLKERENK